MAERPSGGPEQTPGPMPLLGAGLMVVGMHLLLSFLCSLAVGVGLVGLVVLLVGAVVAPLADGDLRPPRRKAA